MRENSNLTAVVTVIAGIVDTEIGRSGPKSACEQQARKETRNESQCTSNERHQGGFVAGYCGIVG